MPETANLLIENLPSSGWSSSWGLAGMPRPGGMAGSYWIQTTDATGFAETLNNGFFLFYNGVGSINGVSYPSPNNLPFSAFVIRANWTPDFGDPSKLTIDLTFASWFEGGIPCEWGKSYTGLTWPTPREPFTLPSPPDSPCPSFPATIPNDIILTPLTDYAVTIWRSGGP